jgi:hypothetical protein
MDKKIPNNEENPVEKFKEISTQMDNLIKKFDERKKRRSVQNMPAVKE